MNKHPLSVRRAMLLAVACATVLSPGATFAASGFDAAANMDHAGIGANPADAGAHGDVAELTRLIQSASLNELRTTYNGGYGASLFFHARDLTYYVALFQDKHFWRVIKLPDEARAEEIYVSFAKQTEQLADVDIRRTKLQAQTAYIERMIGLSEDRAKRLQADLGVARDQQAKVAEYQRQARSEALVLRDEKEKAQSQLRLLQQQVQQLQQQSEAGLPAAR